MTVIEAQACSVPVVINNAHSMPELIIEGKTGEKAQIASRWWHNGLSFWERPDPQSIYWAMEKIYRRIKEKPQEVIQDCRNNVVENFNIYTIFKTRWLPMIENLQNDLLPV